MDSGWEEMGGYMAARQRKLNEQFERDLISIDDGCVGQLWVG